MESVKSETYGRLPYREVDVLTIPEDVPSTASRRGTAARYTPSTSAATATR